MNERIRELMIEAFQSHYGDPVTQVTREKAIELVSGWGEKFAELLVRECLEIAIEEEQHAPFEGPVETKIRQHFGVEE